jgi:GxxExxY protein
LSAGQFWQENSMAGRFALWLGWVVPIHLPEGLKHLSEDDFRKEVYALMEVVFAVHRHFGRLFDEQVYRAEIARRLGDARTQVMLTVSFGGFRKVYYLDLLYKEGVVLELKVAERLVRKHRAQLLNYLLLLELPHGKLANMRTDSVQHEFVNAPLKHADRICFEVDERDYQSHETKDRELRSLLIPILRDWGTCLEVGLYEEAATHFLGGEAAVLHGADVVSDGVIVGVQPVRLLSPEVAFKITAFESPRPHYEKELWHVLRHTRLRCIQWANIGQKLVTFKTILR